MPKVALKLLLSEAIPLHLTVLHDYTVTFSLEFYSSSQCSEQMGKKHTLSLYTAQSGMNAHQREAH